MELLDQYKHDRKIWDACAKAYEAAIVLGHPDVTAYEHFEEDLIDRMLLFLIRDLKQEIHLYDVGCGTGRLHLRYGLKSLDPSTRDPESMVCRLQTMNAHFQYAPIIAPGLKRVGGVDFSTEMLELARRKIACAGLEDILDTRLYFEQGSAFELQPFPPMPMPVVVTLCNSIGVMQGPEGAQLLFQAMRRAVEDAGGIAIISAYCREAVADYALGNYESTMDASGQPVWLTPDTYASTEFIQQPKAYKRAGDRSDRILVDVYDLEGASIKKEHMLYRDPDAVAETIASGHIRTYHEYESRWYATEQFHDWITQWWPEKQSWHIAGRSLDALRGAPAQLAILDAGNHLRPFFERLGFNQCADNYCR